MNRQANVSSIAALRRYQAALREYAETVVEILAQLQIESQRTVDWIQQDRMAYWPREMRHAGEALTEATNTLEMKQLTLNGRDRPACSEEKKAVLRARERKRYTEEQTARTRQLGPIIQHQVDEYRGVLAKLTQLIETDLPRAISTLERKAEALEKYTTIRPANGNLNSTTGGPTT